ncbi:MAG: alpha/beta hydrolase, partial [Acidobacteriota bacterium]
HLEKVHGLAAGDPTAARATPDVLGAVERLLGRLEAEPVTVEVDGQRVAIGALDLKIALSRALSSSRTIADIPAELRRLEDGDWRRLAEEALDHRQVGIYAMALMMDCSSGATPERWRRIGREARDPRNLLGDAILAPFYPEACDGAGRLRLGDDFRGPLESDVPVLFISGTLDVRTPPGNVEELLPGFPNARHLVIENAGHESRELMSPELRDLLQAYLRGEAVESMTITLPEPIFRSVEDLVAAEAEQAEAEQAEAEQAEDGGDEVMSRRGTGGIS